MFRAGVSFNELQRWIHLKGRCPDQLRAAAWSCLLGLDDFNLPPRQLLFAPQTPEELAIFLPKWNAEGRPYKRLRAHIRGLLQAYPSIKASCRENPCNSPMENLEVSLWLPYFIFPFVKAFGESEIFCQKVIRCLFEDCILPTWLEDQNEVDSKHPVHYMENLLSATDLGLYNHCLQIILHSEDDSNTWASTSSPVAKVFLWPIMITAFSEVFVEENFLAFWDLFLCELRTKENEYSSVILLPSVAVAFFRSQKTQLLRSRSVEEVELIIRKRVSSSPFVTPLQLLQKGKGLQKKRISGGKPYVSLHFPDGHLPKPTRLTEPENHERLGGPFSGRRFADDRQPKSKNYKVKIDVFGPTDDDNFEPLE